MKNQPRFLTTIVATLLLGGGVAHANAPAGRYTTPASGTVYDTKTKLTWQQATAPGTYTWGSETTAGTAQYYCANLGLSGAAWRVPTLKELQTLVDYSQPPGSTATIDASFFPGTPANGFWSATPANYSPGDAWYVDFSHGNTPYASYSSSLAARCVH